ncbi:MAG: hypothetical protein ACLRPT_01280 [Akkermansia muciniphila]
MTNNTLHGGDYLNSQSALANTGNLTAEEITVAERPLRNTGSWKVTSSRAA